MKTFLMTTAAVLGLTQVALAADAMDADGDGMVTLQEAQAANPDLTEAAFTELDANGDGMLDQDEVAAAVAGGQLSDSQG